MEWQFVQATSACVCARSGGYWRGAGPSRGIQAGFEHLLRRSGEKSPDGRLAAARCDVFAARPVASFASGPFRGSLPEAMDLKCGFSV